MNTSRALALALDPTLILAAQGLTPDPWQRELLFSTEPHLLLNCSRQSGKSTIVATVALHQMLFTPNSLVLLVSPSERQSIELFRKVLAGYHALGQPLDALRANERHLELANGSRVVALPGREETIRSFSGVKLLILDEAARVPDVLYRSVRPMLAVSRGRLLALSTPFGRSGWFYEEWSGAGPWKRIHIPWTLCPRITPEFIAEETGSLGQAWVDQEYNCLFTALEGLVFPDFEKCIVIEADLTTRTPTPLLSDDGEQRGVRERVGVRAGEEFPGRRVGGIDFGWRNPFAAIWGFLDRDDVLWITHERYLRETPMSEHAAALPKEVLWHADPSGGTEIAELRRADRVVKRGDNNIRRGIALVTARIRTGRLKVLASCKNLIAEARLYRWPTATERVTVGENPIDAHNHALAALRYLVTRIEVGGRGQEAGGRNQELQEEQRGADNERFWNEA